jgi:hypothetical protein
VEQHADRFEDEQASQFEVQSILEKHFAFLLPELAAEDHYDPEAAPVRALAAVCLYRSFHLPVHVP